MGRRRQARETALQALYLADISKLSSADAMAIVGKDGLDEKTEAFVGRLLDGALAELPEIDERIRSTADNWELHRMAAVDRSILRMAAYELLRCPDTPVGVVIDEALEIAKKFSSEDSRKFINGILGKLKDKR